MTGQKIDQSKLRTMVEPPNLKDNQIHFNKIIPYMMCSDKVLT